MVPGLAGWQTSAFPKLLNYSFKLINMRTAPTWKASGTNICKMTAVNHFINTLYLHANTEYRAQKGAAICLTNTEQKRKKITQNTRLKSLAYYIRGGDESFSSCANIHQLHVLLLTISVIIYKINSAEITAAHFSWLYLPHARQTQRRWHAENYIWKHTRAVHLMIISGSSAYRSSCLHSWTEKVVF